MNLLVVDYLFGNLFEDPRITTTRLANFAEDALNRFEAQNQNAEYASVISYLQDPLNRVLDYISKVDVALGIQKGTTLTVDEFIALFKKTMSEKEGVIADAVGGFASPGYLAFYPHGVKEYSRLTKTKIPTLINRVNTVATTHAAQLSPILLATLQAFKTSWENDRSMQEQQKGTVSDNRIDRNILRIDLELGLLQAIHALGLKFPGNTAQCVAFFNFNLLYPVSRTRKPKNTPAT